MKYSLDELRRLWEVYHDLVHSERSPVPCDACPGDVCYATSFFDWLENQEKLRQQLLARIRPIGEEENA